MNRISELRKKHGLSQSDLSKELGIAQNTLSQYENERRMPTTYIIEKLSAFFDVSPNYVLGLPEQKIDVDDTKNQNIMNATLIKATDSVRNVNLYLRMGWKLLHVGQYTPSDPECSSYIVYTVGWFGDPNDVVNISLDDSDDHVFQTW